MKNQIKDESYPIAQCGSRRVTECDGEKITTGWMFGKHIMRFAPEKPIQCPVCGYTVGEN